MSKYTLSRPVPDEVQVQLDEYSPLLQQLLYCRGITTKEDASYFLHPSYDEHLHDPFLLHDMEKAVARTLQAIARNEPIVIYSDYDCDGIPGAVVLHDFFKAIRYTHFSNYIPHRHYEGFGFNGEAAQKLAKQGAKLLITIDCGTTDFDAVAYAQSHGVDVIVSDHHEAKEDLPNAFAIINPKVGDSYPFSGLCGSAVIYKFVQALIEKGQAADTFSLPSGWEKWWLDMVGLATIADMVPLLDENRALAHFGLQVLRKSRRPGLQQLLYKQRANMRYLTEDDIGFTIGPRINAASRMDTPEDAFLMLATTDEADAGARVEHLEKLNNERKGVVAAMTKEIKKRLTSMEDIPSVLVLGNPSWRPSLVGIVANKLAEEYKRPAFLWGRDGNGVLKGSCRSDGTTSVVVLMESVSELFTEYGGHHLSGGFGVKEAHIHELASALCEAFAKAGNTARIDAEVMVDAEMTLDGITASFLTEHMSLAPFGIGNPKPLYLFKAVTPTEVSVFGKTKEHTKLTFVTQGLAQEAIAFFKLPEEFNTVPRSGVPVNIYAHVEQSFFMGRLQTRLRIVDIV